MTSEEILKISKPILFNTEMVKAILGGRKTVTRRPVKTKKFDVNSYDFKNMETDPYETRIDRSGNEYPYPLKGLYANFSDGEYFPMVKAPYNIGDFLYVWETWKQAVCDPAGGGYGVTDLYLYKADEPIDITGIDTENKWRPSIHMPKEATRIFLRVMSVRVEQLQDISQYDTVAEGAPCGLRLYGGYCGNGGLCVGGLCACDDYKQEFASLWNTTVKKSDLDKYGWEANPWVWAIEFERVEVE